MNSLTKEIDAPTLAAQIRMERQKHKGSFLLLEGLTDIRRFTRFIDKDACSIVNCFGKHNVTETIERLYDDGFPGALGLADADFDRLLGALKIHEGLIHSDKHDFDIDTATTGAFELYLDEVADVTKLRSKGGARPFLAQLLESLKPLSVMRFACKRHSLRFKLKDLEVQQFFDGSRIDLDRMIECAREVARLSDEEVEVLRGHVDHYMNAHLDLYQLTSGHDFCAALGVCLRGEIGDRRPPQTWRSEIEIHFRLAFDTLHLVQTTFMAGVRQWEQDNRPYQVLS